MSTAAYNARWSGWRKAIQRLRGAGLLCADAASLAPKSDLTTPTRSNRGASGKTLRAEPAASGCDALPHSRLRLAPLAERELPRHGAMPALRRPCRTRGTCRRTSTPWSDFGKNPSPRTSALEIQPDYYHASDFTVYAHLQLAQDAKADAMIRRSLPPPTAAIVRSASPISRQGRYAGALCPGRADWPALPRCR